MILPHPSSVDNLVVAGEAGRVVSTFTDDATGHRLTLYRAPYGGFTLVSADGPGPTLERRRPRGWAICPVEWTAPESLEAFAAWCATVEAFEAAPDEQPAQPAAPPAAPERLSGVDLSDIMPISAVAPRLASLLKTGRPIVITQRGYPAAVLIDLDTWEALRRHR